MAQLSEIVKSNVTLDVRCCLKAVVVNAISMGTLEYRLHLVPTHPPPNGLGIQHPAAWQQLVRKTVTCLRRRGYTVTVSPAAIQPLATKPIRKIAQALVLNIYANIRAGNIPT